MYREDFLDYPDRSRTRFRINKNTSRQNIVLIHGIGESLELYEYMFPYFDRAGMSLHAIELAGHGASSGIPAHIDSCESYLRDLKRFIYGNLRNTPVYCIGHDIGALTAMRLAEDPRFHVEGLVLTSPVMSLKLDFFLRTGIVLLAKLMPEHRISPGNALMANITHVDETAQAISHNLSKGGGGITAGLIRAVLREQKYLSPGAEALRAIKTLLILGEEDIIIDTQKVISYYQTLFNGTDNLKVIQCKNCFHAVLLEKNRLNFIENIIKWIQTRGSEI